LVALTPPASSVEATVPAVPSVWVAKFTSTEVGAGAVDRVRDRRRTTPMRHHRHVHGANAGVGAVGDDVVDQVGRLPVGGRPGQ
jgi:hypothetical protein